MATLLLLGLTLAFLGAFGRATVPRTLRAPLRTYRTRDVVDVLVLGARRFIELGRRRATDGR